MPQIFKAERCLNAERCLKISRLQDVTVSTACGCCFWPAAASGLLPCLLYECILLLPSAAFAVFASAFGIHRFYTAFGIASAGQEALVRLTEKGMLTADRCPLTAWGCVRRWRLNGVCAAFASCLRLREDCVCGLRLRSCAA